MKDSIIPKSLQERIRNLDSIKTKKQAIALLEEYRKHSIYANQNIGYMIGYYDKKTRDRLHRLFDVDHPIFGRGY